MTAREVREVQRLEIERRRLAGEISRTDATELALQLIKSAAQSLVDGAADPLETALDIYSIAWSGGGWDDDEPSDDLAHWGAEFIQIHDQLERFDRKAKERHTWEAFAREAAASGLAGRPFPGPPPIRPLM